jgi:hypothetical protein
MPPLASTPPRLLGSGTSPASRPAKAHVRLRAVGVGRRVRTPDGVDQPVRRYDLVPLDHQRGQYGALPPPAEVHDRAVPRRRDLAEHVQVKLRLPVHPSPSRSGPAKVPLLPR